MKKKHQSLQQRMEAERARRNRRPEPLAYFGTRYKKEELIQAHFHTEIGIYETSVMFQDKLTDHHVRAGLEELVRQMQAGVLPRSSQDEKITVGEGKEHDLLIFNIRRNWEYLQSQGDMPSWENLIGVVRTILGDVINRASDSPDSRRYLDFLAGFLRTAGVDARLVKDDELDEFP